MPNTFRFLAGRCVRNVLVGILLCSAASVCLAHDIPSKAILLVYVKPEIRTDGNRLLLLVRAPLEAFSEVQFPSHGPGYLDFAHADDSLKEAARVYLLPSMHLFAEGTDLGSGQLLKTRANLPSDKSFASFNSALANIDAPPLDDSVELYWKQASLDVLIAYPIPASIDVNHAKFTMDAEFRRLAMVTHTTLRFVPLTGAERVFEYTGNPGRIALEPGWWHAFAQFVQLGFFHILDGTDHLLFLFCLLIPTRSIRALIPMITAFTLAHSITLISSALNLVPTAMWFPPLIEMLIALSVFYMACENIFGAPMRLRWVIVFCFGLVHGFGFSFILADRMQFAGAHLLSALLAFNVGVELGQFFVLLIAVPLLVLAFKLFARVPNGEKTGTILLSAIAAHSAWHWLMERSDALMQYSWQWPEFDAAFFAAALRWLMLLMTCGAILWVVRELIVYFKKLLGNPLLNTPTVHVEQSVESA